MYRLSYITDAPYAGGAERYLALLLAALDRRRFEPSVIARAGEGLDGWCEEIARAGVPVERVAMNLPFRPLSGVGIVRSLRRFVPHLVHLNMPGPYDAQMGLLAPLSRLAGAGAVVATEHLPMVEPLWKRAFVKRFSARWIDRVITVCEANVPFLLSRQRVPAGKITVVHNALPAAYGAGRERTREELRRELAVDSGSIAVAVVGSLIRRKGLHTLLEALSTCAGRSWRLFVVGSGEERTAYERMAETLSLGGRVEFLGQLPQGDVERLFSGMDLLVVPSTMEGFPYVILEAMACALPVVASRINGIPEAAPDGEAAVLVRAGDVAALREALETLMDNSELRSALGRRGRRRFEERFTMDRHAERVQEIYLELLERGTSRKRGEL